MTKSVSGQITQLAQCLHAIVSLERPTAPLIAQHLELSNGVVRARVNELISMGAPIISGRSGYILQTPWSLSEALTEIAEEARFRAAGFTSRRW